MRGLCSRRDACGAGSQELKLASEWIPPQLVKLLNLQDSFPVRDAVLRMLAVDEFGHSEQVRPRMASESAGREMTEMGGWMGDG